MDKTARTQLHRLFLIESLPEPLTPASSHIQIFDNYVENTRLRLRQIRDPYTRSWTRTLQQRFTVGDEHLTKLAEIHLNDDEYAVFKHFEDREIRKNRYFHEFDGKSFAFDIYLGRLWGLSTAKVEFNTRDSMAVFVPPPFTAFEVSTDPFFAGSTLVDKNFSCVQAYVQSSRLEHS